MESVATGRPFALEYRMVHRDGSIRWVLERGLAQQAGDGRWWLDGAIFDITARREAERAAREHELTEVQLAEVRASPRASWRRPTAPAATSSATSTTVPSSASCPSRSGCGCGSRAHKDLPEPCRAPVLEALDELSTGMGELRALARGSTRPS